MTKLLFTLMTLITIGLCLCDPVMAATGPVITNVTHSPNPIPVAGGSVTVNATVTDTSSTLTNVVLDETRPGYSGYYRTAPMTVEAGGKFKATIAVDLNSNNSANGETLLIEASDEAGNEASFTVATQSYSNQTPSVTNITLTPGPIPAKGATETVTAQVTDPELGISSVVLQETRSGYSGYYRVAPMSVGSDGVTYTASIQVDLNTNNQQTGETLYILATDRANNQTQATVGTQQYSNKMPSVTKITFTPDPIPVAGADVTVHATVGDIALGLSSVVLEETRPGYNGFYRSAPMTAKAGVYSATIPVDENTDTGANGETLYIYATDPAGNQTVYDVATQGYSNVPPTGTLPLLSTGDESAPVLVPSSVTHGGPELTLQINGTNFALSGTTVLFNGVTLAPDSVTSTQISVNIPPSLTATPGSYAVTVVNPSPGGASNSVNLVVN